MKRNSQHVSPHIKHGWWMDGDNIVSVDFPGGVDIEHLEAGDRIEVVLEDGSTKHVDARALEPANPEKFHNSPDLAQLSYLNEPSVYWNLRTRYLEDQLYTYSGLFLVAVNPWKEISGLYGDSVISQTRGRRREDGVPHIYAVCDESFRDLVQNSRDQTILITGESGSGKTVNTAHVIEYFTKTAGSAAVDPSDSARSSLERRIVQANPVLEAFGNSQTVRNNNSSRFGKFIKVQFDRGNTIVGADIEHYLLEKSRVVYHDKNERSFHVFYQLLHGASSRIKRECELLPPESYQCLGEHQMDSAVDHRAFETLCERLQIIGIDSAMQLNVWKLISAVMLMSNVKFVEDQKQEASVSNTDVLNVICKLIQVDAVAFENTLLRPMIRAGESLIETAVSRQKAESSMRAIAMRTYEVLFKWIVAQINQSIGSKSSFDQFIGVLDIAGFEIFTHNSFEQLCINLTNEKLQQFFNHHMFIVEQEEYRKEGIEWKFIDFGLDLQPTIDLIEKPLGIMSILDEECLFPLGRDDTFIQKVFERHLGKHPNFSDIRFQGTSFLVKHYAGSVPYETTGWTEKNKDPVNEGLEILFSSSGSSFISGIFSYASAAQSPTSGGAARRKGAQFITLSQRYRTQLSDLVHQLRRTNPHFVRCLLPNNDKKPGVLDSKLVISQLQCNGVLEGIRISRMGFPSRIIYEEFVRRFRILVPAKKDDSQRTYRDSCKSIISGLEITPDEYRFGSSKLFMKAGTLGFLEEERSYAIGKAISGFQSRCRGFLSRRRYTSSLRIRQSIMVIQRNVRNFSELKKDAWWTLFSRIKPLLEMHAKTKSENRLKQKIVELQKQIESLETEKEQSAFEFSDKKRKLAEENREISNALEETIRAMTRLEQTRGEQQIELSDLKDVNQSLKNTLEDLKTDIAALEKDKASVQKELRSRESQMGDLSAAHSKQMEAHDSLRKELSTQVEEGIQENSLLQKKTNELLEKIRGLEEANGRLESKMQESQEQNRSLTIQSRNSLSDAKSLRKSLDFVKVDHEDLKQKYQALQLENRDMSSKLRDTEDQQRNLKRQSKTLIFEKDEFEQSLSRASTKVLELEASKSELETRVAALEDELKDEMALRETADGTAADLRKKLEQISKGSEESIRIVKDDRFQLESKLNKELETVRLENESLQKKSVRLEARLQEAQQTSQSTKDQLSEASKARNQVEKLLRKSETSVKELSMKVDALARESELMQTEMENERQKHRQESESQAAALRSSEIEESKRRALDLEKQVSELEDSLAETTAALKQAQSDLDDKATQLNLMQQRGDDFEHKFLQSLRDIDLERRKTRRLEKSVSEKEAVDVELKELQQTVKKRDDAIENLHADLKASDSRVVSLKAQKTELEDRIRQIEHEKSELHSSARSSSRTIADSEREKQKMDTTIKTVMGENAELRSTVAQLYSKLEKGNVDLESYRTRIKRLAVELSETKQSLMQYDEELVDQSNVEKEKLKSEIGSLTDQLEDFKNSHDELIRKLAERDSEVTHLKSMSRKSSLIIKDPHSETVGRLKKEVADLKDREVLLIAERNRISSDERKSRNDLESQRGQINELHQNLNDLKVHLDQSETFAKGLQTTIDLLEKEKQSLSEQVDILELSSTSQKNKYSELQERENVMHSTIVQLKKELTVSADRLEDSIKRIDLLTDAKLRLTGQLGEMKNANTELEEQTDSLKDVIEELEVKLDVMSKTMQRQKLAAETELLTTKDAYEAKVLDITLKLSKLQTENSNLAFKLKTAAQESNAKNQTFATRESERKSLASKNSDLDKKNKDLAVALHKLERENDSLHDSNQKLEFSVAELRKEVSGLQEKKVDSERKLMAERTINQSLTSQLDHLQADHEMLSQKHIEVETERSSLADRAARFKEEAAKVGRNSKLEKGQMDDLKLALEKVKTEYEQKLQESSYELKNQIRSLREDKAAAEERSSYLAGQTLDLQTKFDKVSLLNEESQKEIAHLQGKYRAAKKNIESSRRTKVQLQAEISDSRELISGLKLKLDAMHDELEDQKVQIASLSRKTEKHRIERKDRETEVKNVAEENIQLKQAFETLYMEHDAAVQRIHDQQEKIDHQETKVLQLEERLQQAAAELDAEKEVSEQLEASHQELTREIAELKTVIESSSRHEKSVVASLKSRYESQMGRLRASLDKAQQESQQQILNKREIEKDLEFSKRKLLHQETMAISSSTMPGSGIAFTEEKERKLNMQIHDLEHRLRLSEGRNRKAQIELDKTQFELRQLEREKKLREASAEEELELSEDEKVEPQDQII